MSDNSWIETTLKEYFIKTIYAISPRAEKEAREKAVAAIELHLQQDYDMRLKVADKTARVDELTELIKDAHGHGVMSPLRLAPRIKERLDTLVAELNAIAAELTPQDKTGSKEVFEQD